MKSTTSLKLFIAAAALLSASTLHRAIAAELPVTPSAEKPVILLGFGETPYVAPGSDPAITVFKGKVTGSEGTDYAKVRGSDAVAAHKGFGEWSVTMQFDLESAIKPGRYDFHARYHQGGEASQIAQTFVIKAGPDASSLEERGTVQLRNEMSWKSQWLKAEKTIELKEGDKVIEIHNSGKADGAKVFEAFLLSPS
jgi:hypothetical protein